MPDVSVLGDPELDKKKASRLFSKTQEDVKGDLYT